MLLYLHNSVLNRPFDDQSQARVWLETLSFAFVLSLIEFGEAKLLRSPIHEVENRNSPDPERQSGVNRCLALADLDSIITINDSVRTRALELEQQGVKSFDALHLACAEALHADVFLTCDDRLLRRYSGTMRVENPAHFITTLT